MFIKRSVSGLVGLQDSGKTTLLNKVWGLHGSTGLFAHTDVPVMHRITNKVRNIYNWHYSIIEYFCLGECD